MTIELRTLRVSAQMDASQYTAAAQQKVAADRAMSASGKEAAAGISTIGQAVTQTEVKLSQAGDGIEKFKRQLVTGYGASVEFERGMNTLQRAIDKGRISAEQAESALVNLHRRTGLIAESSQLAAKGQLELAAAVERANTRIAAQRTHSAANQNDRNQNFAGFNAGQQLQDIVMMTALGQSPMTLAIQQGPQLASAIQMGGGLSALQAGLMSLISPTMLITTGLVAAGAAAVQFFSSWDTKGKSLESILSAHEKAVRQIGDAYGYAASQAKTMPIFEGRGAELLSAVSENQLRLGLQREANSIVAGSITPVGFPFAVDDVVSSEFEPFEEALRSLQQTAKNGNPDIAEFRRLVSQRWALDPLNQDLTTTAGKLLDLSNNAMRAVEYLRQLEQMRLNRVEAYRQYGMSREAGPAAKDAEDELKRRLDGERDAAMQAEIRARTFAERLAAVRMQAAQGDPVGRADRVRAAELEERTRQEMELRDALKARSDAQRASIEQLQLEAATMGQAAGEIARTTEFYRAWVALRAESERTGEPISAEALKRAREYADEMGRIVDANAKLRLQQSLQFERDQMFRSPDDQRIAGMLRSAGLPVDLESEAAKAARLNIELERMRDTWQSIFDTAGNGIDSLVDSLFEGGKDIGETLKSIGRDFARLMFDLAATNPLKNWLTGSNLPSIADLGIFGDGASSGRGGGFGGVLGNLLGAQKAVASMQVQAASVVINGGVLGGAGGVPGLGNVSRLLSGGNDNFGPPKSLSGIGSPNGSPAGNISSYASAIKAIESGGRYSALGPLTGGDRAYGAYQVMGTNVGPWTKQALGYSMTPQDFLNDPKAQDAVFNKIFGGYVDKFGASGAAQAWFGGPGSVGKGGAGRDILGTSGSDYVAKFNANLEKLGDTTASVASGLGGLTGVTNSTMQALSQFGIGANNVGSMLSNLMNTGGGFGGNWFSNLAGMFGGQGGALSHMMSISPAATAHILKGGVGLFADGTESAPPGWAWVGERGPELMKMRGGETIRDHRTSVRMASAAANQNASRGGGMSRGDVEAIVSSIAAKLKLNVKNVNVMDISAVGDYLRTEEGEQLVMNIHRRRA